MENLLINTGDDAIVFKWGGFTYNLGSGEWKNFPITVYNAILKRFSQVKPYKPAVKVKKVKEENAVN